MNVLGQFFFSLFLLYFLFGITLQIVSFFNKTKKGLVYLFLSYLAMALMFLGTSIMLFTENVLIALYITGPLRVVILPLLYIYFKKLNQKSKALQKGDLFHFVPFVFEIVFTFIIVTYLRMNFAEPGEIQLSNLMNSQWENHFYYNLLAITARSIAFIQAIVYAIYISKTYQKLKASFLMKNSQISYVNLRWIKWVKYILLFNGLLSGAELFGLYTNPVVIIFSIAFLVFNAFFFLIHALIQNDYFLEEQLPVPTSVMVKHQIVDSKKLNELIELFKTKKIYLKVDLCLVEACHELNISKNKFAACIKQAGYDNFYHFVNHFRILQSKELLKNISPQHSIDSVVKESGFKSRATFYRVFKDYSGMTPSEFIASQNNE